MCLERKRQCPIDRQELPADYKPIIDREQGRKVALKFKATGKQVNSLKKKFQNPLRGVDFGPEITTIEFIYGNRYEEVKNPRPSRDGKHLNKHMWTAFFNFRDEVLRRKISKFVDKL